MVKTKQKIYNDFGACAIGECILPILETQKNIWFSFDQVKKSFAQVNLYKHT